jgi:hypothetical protein
MAYLGPFRRPEERGTMTAKVLPGLIAELGCPGSFACFPAHEAPPQYL